MRVKSAQTLTETIIKGVNVQLYNYRKLFSLTFKKFKFLTKRSVLTKVNKIQTFRLLQKVLS